MAVLFVQMQKERQIWMTKDGNHAYNISVLLIEVM
jgi:hypothetical protein